jgi:hypothetical protein
MDPVWEPIKMTGSREFLVFTATASVGRDLIVGTSPIGPFLQLWRPHTTRTAAAKHLGTMCRPLVLTSD